MERPFECANYEMVCRKVCPANYLWFRRAVVRNQHFAIHVFFSCGIQVCKKINTFLWVCQVFVLFFFVLWHLKPCGITARFFRETRSTVAGCTSSLLPTLRPKISARSVDARVHACVVIVADREQLVTALHGA
jgi:hypothetical protein